MIRAVLLVALLLSGCDQRPFNEHVKDWFAKHCSGGGWYFQATEDITAFELAEILRQMSGALDGKAICVTGSSIPSNISRHFYQIP